MSSGLPKGGINVKLVSVAILNFNRENYLGRSIRSALSQKLGDFAVEVVVIDDGSSDGSLAVARNFPAIRLVALEENRGVGYASDVALHASRGEYFIRVDSDDFLSQDAVRTLVAELERDGDLAYAHGDIRQIDEITGQKRTIRLDKPEKLYRFGAGVLFRKSLLQIVGGYDVGLRNCEDLDLFLKLESLGMTGVRVPEALYRHHLHRDNTSMQPDRVEMWEKVFRKYGMEPFPQTMSVRP